MAKCPQCGHVYKDPARVKGGKKSRRTLKPEVAKDMVKKREEKRTDDLEQKKV
ncbi:hypothetical protein KAR91_83935 [Candidatus Pacearchaeota archaeon]|nr:hypothetical protein [Candidatus Pacearchaeota archaeon]